jgi:hypothetical protein
VTINVAGVTLTAGNLNGGSGTLNVSGTWTGTTGFTPGIGTVNYNGAAAQTVAAVTYNNLILSGGGTKAITGGSTSVGGNLSISSGVTLALSAGINVQVKALTLNGTNVASGTWGSTSSGATHKDSHFSGTGIITVG